MRRIIPGLLAALVFSGSWWLAGTAAHRRGFAASGRSGAASAALLSRGLGELENERDAEAEATFAELSRRAPLEPAGPANHALALARLGRFDEAFAAADEALRRAPDWPELHVLRADLLSTAGRSEEALADLERAAGLEPDDPGVHFRRLEEANASGDEPRARDALANLVRLRPESLPVLVESARSAAARGDRPATTTAVLRLREILGAREGAAADALAVTVAALEEGDPLATRSAVERLANSMRGEDLFRTGLAEFRSGVLGDPVERLRSSGPKPGFGPPRPTRWARHPLGDAPGGALAIADFDGDGRPDLARVRATDPAAIELRLSSAPGPGPIEIPLSFDPSGLLTVDLDDDGAFDLLAWGTQATGFWRGDGSGGFTEATTEWGLGKGAEALVPIDFDLDGDLDLALFGAAFPHGALLRSSLAAPLVVTDALPAIEAGSARAAVATDHDRDGDPDLVVLTAEGILLLDNLRQGRFADRGSEAGLGESISGFDLAAGDLDGDLRPDLVVGTANGPLFSGNNGGRYAPPRPLATGFGCRRLVVADFDNDGRLDVACAGPGGVRLLQADAEGGHEVAELPGTREPSGLAVADFDRDGDLDLALSGPGGLDRLENLDGNRSSWLAVRLAGLAEGNGKNNRHGRQAVIEVFHGGSVQRREVDREVTHFGLGEVERADRLRVVWTNGVPQNRLGVTADQLVVEEQVLKGSCPFLYAWTGERFEFVTDLLWNAPLGLPVAPGVWASPDPEELVRVDGVRVDETGRIRLRITEELWEAAFFDRVRLWAVDHPGEVEVASTLKVLPGARVDDRVVGSRDLRPLAGATDGDGRRLGPRVAARDEIYADAFEIGRFQGASHPWTLEFDLGAAPAAPIRLHLDAWVFPADASLNLAIAQRPDLPFLPPRLEMATPEGWRTLVDSIGYPAGKTKTMVVDTPALPPGVRRLRIVSSLWLGFDRVAWTPTSADGEVTIVARLDPVLARLGFGGFSTVERTAPNGPHRPDYARRDARSPWLPFPGRYTRYGDVRELLTTADDRSVILGPGDELELAFDVAALPPPPPGARRTWFLESHGWDKDADRNTWEAAQLEPLPFRAMKGYPDPTGARFPDDALHRSYVEQWLTREVFPPER